MLGDPTPVGPPTRSTLADDFRRLGVRPGDTVLLHSSLRAVGWVVGGATALVHALLDVLGPTGTVVAPAQTPLNRDPSRLADPPLPEQWWPVFREHLPAFDPAITPSETVGVVAERIRTWPGASRSAHPQTSFAGIGPAAAEILADHALDSPLGERSPLARLVERDATVLLVGVGFEACTTFHLAEYRLPDPPVRTNSCAVLVGGERNWVTYTSVALDATDFGELGREFRERTDVVTDGLVGAAASLALPARRAADFAVQWMARHRPSRLADMSSV
ncbi:aminoglycoside N(3)-acetyltransferase [Plantactinospora sp. GCM10030261]|uniref:aminoglycoside N(3)-acetyltransferase n=1 Tax=Plantactinospora sp. GCM10030261 TaxID=3273420 RepID=UPI00360BEDE1